MKQTGTSFFFFFFFILFLLFLAHCQSRPEMPRHPCGPPRRTKRMLGKAKHLQRRERRSQQTVGTASRGGASEARVGKPQAREGDNPNTALNAAQASKGTEERRNTRKEKIMLSQSSPQRRPFERGR